MRKQQQLSCHHTDGAAQLSKTIIILLKNIRYIKNCNVITIKSIIVSDKNGNSKKEKKSKINWIKLECREIWQNNSEV